MKPTFILLLSALPFSSFAENCQTTREFVTALEFIRADGDNKIKETAARDLAFQIAEGCTGSAQRYIRVSKLLTRAGMKGSDASPVALKLALADDVQTDTFTAVFRRSVAEDGLDLDGADSVKLALSLSRDFSGDQKKVREDFDRVVEYCSDFSRLGLSKTDCGPFAAAIAKSGEKWRGGVSAPFFKTFEYLKSENGPALITADALRVAKQLSEQGPGAFDNFRQAFQYATSKSGLEMPRDQALQFAQKMASIEKPYAKTEAPVSSPDKKSSQKNR